MQKEWRGKNVFIDFPESDYQIPEKALKSNSIFLSSYESVDKRLALKPPKKAVAKYDAIPTSIAASQIDDYVQAHFF